MSGDVILLKNVTEFKEKDIAKTTFISTISHELKTPISAIMMSLELLEDNRIGKLNTEQESLSKNIKENSDRLLEITGELLKMSQVESGKLYLNPKITKPIELIDYAIKANRVQAERFNCQIEVEYPEKDHQIVCRQRENCLGCDQPVIERHPLFVGERTDYHRCTTDRQSRRDLCQGLRKGH